ncbi:MAG TPA: hypothetical protein VHF22_03745, partial [Planctomycetota bacterium]|nr:hypothetical protein [Planctomycetota bacterium]
VRAELPPGLDLVAIPLDAAREPALVQLERSIAALARKALQRLEARERTPAPAAAQPVAAPPLAAPPPSSAAPPPAPGG